MQKEIKKDLRLYHVINPPTLPTSDHTVSYPYLPHPQQILLLLRSRLVKSSQRSSPLHARNIAAHTHLSVLLWIHHYSFTVRTVIIAYPWYLISHKIIIIYIHITHSRYLGKTKNLHITSPTYNYIPKPVLMNIISHTISYYRSDTICRFVNFTDLLMMGNLLPETCRDKT